MSKDSIEEQLAKAIGMKEHKKIDVESYSSAELLYLEAVILKEIDSRNQTKNTAMQFADKEKNRLEHDIELNFEGTNTDKIAMFDELRQTLADRRHIKQENNILTRMAYAVHLNQSKTQALNFIAELLNEHDKRETTGYGYINECVPQYRQGEFKRLLTKIKTH